MKNDVANRVNIVLAMGMPHDCAAGGIPFRLVSLACDEGRIHRTDGDVPQGDHGRR